MTGLMLIRTNAGSTLAVALPDARSYTTLAFACPTVIVTMGSVDGAPLINGFGRILTTTAAEVAVEVRLAATVVADDVDPPTVASSVLLPNTLSISAFNVPLGSAVVIGARNGARAGPTWVASRIVLAESPSEATTPDPVATGLPPATAALVCEQARPKVTMASACAPRSGLPHVWGLLADVLSPVTSDELTDVCTAGVA